MYLFRNNWLEQINIEIDFLHKPSIDLCIHWIDPLLHKCDKRLYQDLWSAVKQSQRSSPGKVL
ncbi:UNVERIFIED_CONTAM: hypothetical protein Cloal_1689 [Acetivibrio alkalicellulosi]